MSRRYRERFKIKAKVVDENPAVPSHHPIFRRNGSNEPSRLVLQEIALVVQAVPDKVVAARLATLRKTHTPEEIEAAAIGLSNILGGGWHG